MEGFHDGGDTWRLRFAADEEGEWQYLLRGEGVELFEQGRLQVKPAAGRGVIRIHSDNPYAFAYADGTAYFPMGDTCYGLFDDGPITPELRRQYLDTRRRQRFNFVSLSIGHSQYRAAADPAYWAWGGTTQSNDPDRFNPVFFRGFDQLLGEVQACRLNAEVLLFNYYRPPLPTPPSGPRRASGSGCATSWPATQLSTTSFFGRCPTSMKPIPTGGIASTVRAMWSGPGPRPAW